MGEAVISTQCPHLKQCGGGEVLVRLDSDYRPSGIICPWFNPDATCCNLTGKFCLYQSGWLPFSGKST